MKETTLDTALERRFTEKETAELLGVSNIRLASTKGRAKLRVNTGIERERVSDARWRIESFDEHLRSQGLRIRARVIDQDDIVDDIHRDFRKRLFERLARIVSRQDHRNF